MARKSRDLKVESEHENTTTSTGGQEYHSAQDVANAFVEQYYKILTHFPQHSYKFYREESILSLPAPAGAAADGVRLVTTIKGIDEEIMGSSIKNSSIDLLSVHAQDTVAESVIVVVVGLLNKDKVSKCFTQTFLLAPQARGGFYVQNDFFQFIDVAAAASLNTPQDSTVKDKGTSTEDDIHGINQLRAKNSELVPDEPNTESFSNTQDDVKILSYASIVAKATNDFVTGSEKGQIEKSSPSNAEESIEKKDSYASIVAKETSFTNPQPAASEQVLADRNSTTVPAKPSSASQIDKTIYIRDIPPDATRRTLTHALKRFGSVKHRNIQIRGYPDGYRYAFVEFNNLNAARLAMEAGFIKFDDWECEVESKKAHFEG